MKRPGGKNLNLSVDITWKGIRLLYWKDLDKLISDEIKNQPHPDVLVIHAGSNDLTAAGNTALRFSHEIQCSLYRYNVMLPKTLLIWSTLLPRLYWHGAPLGKGGTKIDLKRCKVNKAIRKFITFEVNGGALFMTKILKFLYPTSFDFSELTICFRFYKQFAEKPLNKLTTE